MKIAAFITALVIGLWITDGHGQTNLSYDGMYSNMWASYSGAGLFKLTYTNGVGFTGFDGGDHPTEYGYLVKTFIMSNQWWITADYYENEIYVESDPPRHAATFSNVWAGFDAVLFDEQGGVIYASAQEVLDEVNWVRSQVENFLSQVVEWFR